MVISKKFATFAVQNRNRKEMKIIRYKMNNDILELRELHEVSGHIDSMAFETEIWLNGNEIGVAVNRGWGGDAVVHLTSDDAELTGKWNEFTKKVGETVWTHIYSETGEETVIKYSIGFLVNCMALDALALGRDEYINLNT